MRRLLLFTGLFFIVNACKEEHPIDPAIRVRPVSLQISVTADGYKLNWEPERIVCITSPCPDLADVEAEEYEIQVADNENGPFKAYQTLNADKKSTLIPAAGRGVQLVARVVSKAKGAPAVPSNPVMATNGFLSQSAYYPGFGLSADVLGGDVARDGSKSTYIVSVDKGAGQYEFQTFLTQLVNEQVISATLINRQGRAGKFSPDGQQLAFVSLANNSLIIYDLSSGQERSVPVADLAFARDIVWSPDGKWLAYNTQTNDGSRLWKLAASGGQPVPLSPVLPVSTENAIRNTTLTWSPDGQLIGLSRVRTDNNGMSWRAVISFYAATGSGETRFFDTQPSWIDTNPQFSPDGKQLAFLSTRTSPAQFIYSLWIRDLTSGTIRRIELLPGLIPSNDYAPRWLGNDRILFMGTQQGKKGFFTVFI